MVKNQALSLRVQWLGDRLKRARETAGYTLEAASEHLQIQRATLSRFENGVYRPKPSYVRDLVDFYGISDERQRATLLQLNEDAWRKDWWVEDSGELDREFIDYAWLESRARHIKAYEPLLIHGLLHTDAYAEATARSGLGAEASPADLKLPGKVRRERQRILDAETPTELSIVIEEAPLYRRIGSVSVHRDQLEHLLQMMKRSHIDIRLVSRKSGWHPGLDGAFTLLEMPDPYPNVSYNESLVGRTFLEKDTKVDCYRDAYDRLQRIARNPRETAKAIREAIKEIG